MDEYSDEFYEESDEDRSELDVNNEFKEKLVELIKNEKIFISTLQDVLETHFVKIYKEMVDHTIVKSVFGELEYFLKLHTKLLMDFQQSCSAHELCLNFILYESELRKHIDDQWKSCEDEDWHTLRNYLKDIDFYNKSSWIIRTYVNFIDSINNDQFVKAQHRHECTKAFKILVDIYKQINFIQEGLKLIMGSNIHIRDCGSVKYKNQFEVKMHSGISFMRKYNFDVFITDKYAIFTESKMIENKHVYEFVDAFLLSEIKLDKDGVNRRITILAGEPKKKKLTMYASNNKKFDQALSYLSQNNI